MEEVLLSEGLLSAEELQRALARIDGSTRNIGPFLVSEGLISEESLAHCLARQHGMDFVDLGLVEVDRRLLKGFPLELMRKELFLPFKREDNCLHIAMADPGNLPLIDDLRLLAGQEVRIYVGTPSMINACLERQSGPEAALEEVAEGFRLSLVPEEEEEEALSPERLKAELSPIIKLVDTIIWNAIERRASDVHIEGTERDVIVKYRIDGMLYQAMEPIDKRFQQMIISRIKIMAELDIAERRVPQDGRFRLRLGQKAIDFRVSILPSNFGEAAVIRILDKETIARELEELKLDRLGFREPDLKRFRKNIIKPHGMVLVTGPTGSGKTTTLYAAISEINSGLEKIVTIEDPIEYQLKNVIQIPVNEKKGLTFARGLRSILRHDPDKIMVGEIRDPETAQIAVQSALTGHLVFTTVHANNVVDVVGRLMAMGLEPYNFVTSLNCILTQRLVRLICRQCKHQVRIPDEFLEESGLEPDGLRDFPFYQGKGCPSCNFTGYRGRTGVFELLEISDRIRELILEKRTAAEIKRVAKEENTTFLREAALEKVFSGLTTLAEANRVTLGE